jgi:hypothetical protein
MKIFMFNKNIVMEKIPDYNDFTFCDWNDMDELPEIAYELMEIAKIQDTVFTEYSFMLCFNLRDKETSNRNYVMFIPDPKFNIV